LKAQRGGSGRYDTNAGQALAAPFDGAVASEDAEPGHRFFGNRAPAEILEEHRPAAQLDGRKPFAEPDADVIRGVSRSGKGENDREG
jgi:hypothetical protein